MTAAAQVLRLLAGRGETLAVAESLTGGLVAAELTSVPGASRAFRGSVTAYATPSRVKSWVWTRSFWRHEAQWTPTSRARWRQAYAGRSVQTGERRRPGSPAPIRRTATRSERSSSQSAGPPAPEK